MADKLRPWWERWPGWWAEQQRGLQLRWGRGSGFKFDAVTHTARWDGSVKLRLNRERRKVPVTIIWGPATPFFPPRIAGSHCHSLAHQLNDGSMCLLPPVDIVNGWEGVVDIGFWLKKAEDWLRRYYDEKWGVALDVWSLLRLSLPGYRYRMAMPEVQIVALPPAWNDMAPGFGGVVVRLPRAGGLAAVLRWERAPGQWSSWPTGEVVTGLDGDDVAGTWVRLDRLPMSLAEAGFKDPALNDAYERHALVEWATSGMQNQDRVALMSVPGAFGDAARPAWVFHQYHPPGLALDADPLVRLVALGGFPKAAGLGIPLDRDTLDARRRAGRSNAMHERVGAVQIVIAGLGSLGSEVAHLLAQEGVRSFLLAQNVREAA